MDKPRAMTIDEYSEAIKKWQEAYQTWNTSCVNYYNTMMMNSLMQQIPALTGGQFLAISINPPDSFDSMTEIRSARLKIAPIWRRFLAEIIDFILLHIFKILIVFSLANHFHFIDANRLTVNYMISSFLYEDALSFPTELICIEFGYLICSIVFESFCLTRFGATPGKRFLRLRVLKCESVQIEDDGELDIDSVSPLNIGAALTRSAFKILMSTFLFPAVIVALLTTQNRQTSYDMAANAIVVELELRD